MPESDRGSTGPFLARRGWTLRERLRAPDSYGLLLVLILASLVVVGLDLGRATPIVLLVAQGGVLLFALRTSRAPGRIRLLGVGLLILAAATAGTSVLGEDAWIRAAPVTVVAVVVGNLGRRRRD